MIPAWLILALGHVDLGTAARHGAGVSVRRSTGWAAVGGLCLVVPRRLARIAAVCGSLPFAAALAGLGSDTFRDLLPVRPVDRAGTGDCRRGPGRRPANGRIAIAGGRYICKYLAGAGRAARRADPGRRTERRARSALHGGRLRRLADAQLTPPTCASADAGYAAHRAMAWADAAAVERAGPGRDPSPGPCRIARRAGRRHRRRRPVRPVAGRDSTSTSWPRAPSGSGSKGASARRRCGRIAGRPRRDLTVDVMPERGVAASGAAIAVRREFTGHLHALAAFVPDLTWRSVLERTGGGSAGRCWRAAGSPSSARARRSRHRRRPAWPRPATTLFVWDVEAEAAGAPRPRCLDDRPHRAARRPGQGAAAVARSATCC